MVQYRMEQAVYKELTACDAFPIHRQAVDEQAVLGRGALILNNPFHHCRSIAPIALTKAALHT